MRDFESSAALAGENLNGSRTANGGDDLAAVLLLGVDPASHLVDVLGVHSRAELVDLHHGLADGGARLLHLGDSLRQQQEQSQENGATPPSSVGLGATNGHAVTLGSSKIPHGTWQ